MINYYECPGCEHEWQNEEEDTYDSECPECGLSGVNPYRSDYFLENTICLYEDALGIYIPQRFAKDMPCTRIFNVASSDLAALREGPPGGALNEGEGHPDYWEIWDEVLDNAILAAQDGSIYYRLEQDGHLWAIPTDLPNTRE